LLRNLKLSDHRRLVTPVVVMGPYARDCDRGGQQGSKANACAVRRAAPSL